MEVRYKICSKAADDGVVGQRRAYEDIEEKVHAFYSRIVLGESSRRRRDEDHRKRRRRRWEAA